LTGRRRGTYHLRLAIKMADTGPHVAS